MKADLGIMQRAACVTTRPSEGLRAIEAAGLARETVARNALRAVIRQLLIPNPGGYTWLQLCEPGSAGAGRDDSGSTHTAQPGALRR